jgi:cell division septal protein FtsQ
MQIPFFKSKKPTKQPEQMGFRREGKITSSKQNWMLVPPGNKKKLGSQSEQLDELHKERQQRKFKTNIGAVTGLGQIASWRPKPSLDFLKVNYIVPLVILAIAVGFGYFLYDQRVFIISAVEIHGNSKISDLQIVTVIGDLRGKSMLQIVGADLESSLQKEFPFIRDVYIDKQIPGKLSIKVEERFPEFAYMNLSGSYLIDQDGIVVEVLGAQQQPPLLDYEKLVLDGYGDVQAEYVFNQYVSNITDDKELAKVKWEEVELEKKEEALKQLRKDLQARVDSLLAEKFEFVSQAGFTELNMAYGFDSELYKVGDVFSPQIKQYSAQITAYLDQESIPLKKILWRSNFTIQVEILARTKLLFTSSRSLAKQLNVFQALRESNKIKTANVIDLRSDTIAVK